MNGDNPTNPPEESTPPVIPYATPVGLGPDQPDFGCWRRGGCVIVARTCAALPPICFKCGQPTERYKLHELTWHHPLFYFLAPTILFAIIILCVQEKAKIRIPVCETHYRKHCNWITISCLTVLAGIGIGVGIAWANRGLGRTEDVALFGLLAGLFATMLALVLYNHFGRIAHATRIDAHFVRLGGAGEQFLNRLPSA
ncbi:MAG: hypothetical protein ACHRHE_20700 [Tepidisphaerales bacterium]